MISNEFFNKNCYKSADKDEMINNDTSVGQRKKKSESPTGIEPMTSHRAGALSTEPRELMKSEAIKLSSCMTRVLYTARNSDVEVVVVNDNVK